MGNQISYCEEAAAKTIEVASLKASSPCDSCCYRHTLFVTSIPLYVRYVSQVAEVVEEAPAEAPAEEESQELDIKVSSCRGGCVIVVIMMLCGVFLARLFGATCCSPVVDA